MRGSNSAALEKKQETFKNHFDETEKKTTEI